MTCSQAQATSAADTPSTDDRPTGRRGRGRFPCVSEVGGIRSATTVGRGGATEGSCPATVLNDPPASHVVCHGAIRAVLRAARQSPRCTVEQPRLARRVPPVAGRVAEWDDSTVKHDAPGIDVVGHGVPPAWTRYGGGRHVAPGLPVKGPGDLAICDHDGGSGRIVCHGVGTSWRCNRCHDPCPGCAVELPGVAGATREEHRHSPDRIERHRPFACRWRIRGLDRRPVHPVEYPCVRSRTASEED